MKIYLVGGAVRDQLLHKKVTERDYVVVGTTPEAMIALGFKPVGKNFPVFLHPDTHEEYALARTEHKTGRGYKGFHFYTDPSITLEDDLKRRDLTINAIAKAKNGRLIDPFGGQNDLRKKILRHVSNAFSEDPVRILRVARFSSTFEDFTIAKETKKLMQDMVASGEVDALVPERVWQEFNRALAEPHPERFIEVLRDCGALSIIFPEIDALFGIPNPAQWHPEIDSGIHSLMVLCKAANLSPSPVVRFAALTHDLGKPLSPKDTLPKHHNHGEKGVPIIKKLCKRLNAPREYEDLAVLSAKYHGLCHKLFGLTPSTIVKLIDALDPFRKSERFRQFLLVCEADAKGRKGFESTDYPQTAVLAQMAEACKAIDNKALIDNLKDSNPSKIKEAIYLAKLKVIKHFKKY